MTRPYLLLILAVMAAALLVVLIARRPHHAAVRSERARAASIVRVTLQVQDGAVTPDPASVPKGSLVELSIANLEASPVRVTLAGYANRVDTQLLAAGRTWRGRFLADRPGQDFAWLIDGRPAGRFAVTGSHLEEGHR